MFGSKTVSFKVLADTLKADVDVDKLTEKLKKISDREFTAKVGTDLKDSVKLREYAMTLDRIGKKVASPRVSVDGLARANLELDKLSLKLDAIDRKGADVGQSWWSRLGKWATNPIFGNGPGANAGIWAKIGSGLLTPAGIGGAAVGAPVAIPGIVSLLDTLLGFGIGTGTAGAGFLGVKKYNPAMLAPGMNNINQTLSSVFQSIGPSVGMMMVGLGKFVQGQAPNLAKLFGASLPFMQAWIKIAEVAAKTILPALTSSMLAFVKSGALTQMVQGFGFLARGIANFITFIGPGVKAGAEIFRGTMMGIDGLLTGLGVFFGQVGQGAAVVFHDIRHYWDEIRAWTAHTFDDVRHVIAENMHSVAQAFDQTRHATAAVWDWLWQHTIGAAIRGTDTLDRVIGTGLSTVVRFFASLPGAVMRALSSLGRELASLGSAAMHELLSGFTSVASSIISFFKSFGSSIVSAFKSVLGIFSPSAVFHEIGMNIAHGLANGVKAGTNKHIAGAMAALHGAVAHGAPQTIARALLARYGWGNQWGALNAVAMRESGWSMTARNPSSGAYGIAQFINGPREYYQYGGNPNTALGQVTAFFNYIRQRYGNPSAAWAHEMRFGWYDQGGKLPPGLTLALNTTGHDETIVNHAGAHGGGNTYVFYLVDDVNPDAAALRTIKKIRKYKERHGNQALGIA